jgi:ParB family chromosome partitioning protein
MAEDLSVRAVEEAVREHGLVEADAAAASAAAGVTPPHAAGPASATSRMRPAGLVELEALLSDHLDTRVKVSMAQHRGRVVVEFADLEDLERIYHRMTQGDETPA